MSITIEPTSYLKTLGLKAERDNYTGCLNIIDIATGVRKTMLTSSEQVSNSSKLALLNLINKKLGL